MHDMHVHFSAAKCSVLFVNSCHLQVKLNTSMAKTADTCRATWPGILSVCVEFFGYSCRKGGQKKTAER